MLDGPPPEPKESVPRYLTLMDCPPVPVGKNTKRFLARATGNAWPSSGKRRPNQLHRQAVGHQDGM